MRIDEILVETLIGLRVLAMILFWVLEFGLLNQLLTLMLELVFDKVVWTNFPMGFSTETSVGRTGTWARCNRHREHYELVYLVVKIRVVLNEKWKSKVSDLQNL